MKPTIRTCHLVKMKAMELVMMAKTPVMEIPKKQIKLLGFQIIHGNVFLQ